MCIRDSPNDENLKLIGEESIEDHCIKNKRSVCILKNHLCGAKILQPECFNEHKENGLPADDIN